MPLHPYGRDELADWLRLVHTQGIGPVAARELLSAFGTPGDVLAADPAALAAVVGRRLASALHASDAQRDRLVAAALEWASGDDRHLVTLADPDYPPLLLQTFDPPPVLYLAGSRAMLTRPAVAVVGSRNATVVGLANARAFAQVLSEAGFAVASGMALGIDGAAHEGALAGAGSTVAVLGTGVDVVYPAAHAALARRIEAGGALLSELPLGTTARTAAFPRRNRLIAGVARAVLVIEAALRSGSLITARLAAEGGRDVFAIPGSIHSPLARGCHALIKQGAKLVESADDLLLELDPAGASARLRREPSEPGAAGREPPLLRAIGHDPVLPDALAAQLVLPFSEVAAGLLRLELQGVILRLSDGRVQRASPNG